MSRLALDFSKPIAEMKVMHAVNNGPCVAGNQQTRGNSIKYAEARFPYARNHDASFFAGYGGEHTVDIHAIFPNFSADENDPESYDFAMTDQYLKQTLDCGTMPFYRLGTKIEHGVKKYGSRVPADFLKWARICEHIIRHYNEGWAQGFQYGIEYWEIWNEPDLINDDGTSPCWQGTEEQFAELYCVASKHLKKCFPDLKIGGPASVGDEEWMSRFLQRTKASSAPIDFFSYHWYWTEPKDMSAKCTRVRRLLNTFGYINTEAVLDEWNYVRGWTDDFIYSIEQIIGMKGAAFYAACMLECQNNPDIDMLMYYDARPGAFNGLFDFYTYRPLKGYYAFCRFADLYELKDQYYSLSDDEDIYAVCANNGKRSALMLTYYAEDDSKPDIKELIIEVNDNRLDGASVFITDAEKSNELLADALVTDGRLTLNLKRNSIIYIEK